MYFKTHLCTIFLSRNRLELISKYNYVSVLLVSSSLAGFQTAERWVGISKKGFVHLLVSEFKDCYRVDANVLLNLMGMELSSWPGLAPRAVLPAFDQDLFCKGRWQNFGCLRVTFFCSPSISFFLAALSRIRCLI